VVAPRIVVAVDDGSLPAALRCVLGGYRSSWDLRCGTAADVPGWLAEAPADVFVTDGDTGLALLREVRTLHPATTCLVLVDACDEAALPGLAGLAHQVLARPCDGLTLFGVINGVLDVRRLLDDDRLRSLLGEVESLPKPPSLHAEILAVTAREDASLTEVAAVIAGDLSLSADILRLVNSPFFGQRGTVSSVERAAVLLGVDTLHALALAGKLFATDAPLPRGLDAVAVRARAERSGAFARAIARAEEWPSGLAGAAFLAAMLHDVGLLALAAADPVAFELFTKFELPGLAPYERERAAFGCSVADVSGYLLGLWGFDAEAVRALVDQPPVGADLVGPSVAHAVAYARHLAGGGEPERDRAGRDADGAARARRWEDAAMGALAITLP
jgi:HD-like signal output (HDOD) protein